MKYPTYRIVLLCFVAVSMVTFESNETSTLQYVCTCMYKTLRLLAVDHTIRLNYLADEPTRLCVFYFNEISQCAFIRTKQNKTRKE